MVPVKKFIISSLLLFVPLHGGTAEIRDAGSYLKKTVVTKRLNNGVQVVMLNRGKTPTLAMVISFRVGSVDESYRTIGMAHMLEHMLFKGTDRIGTKNFQKEKEILDKIEAVGETIDRVRLKNPKNVRLPGLEKKLKLLQKEHSKYVLSSPYSKIYSKNGSVGFNAFTSRDRTAYVIELPASKLELWARLESERLRNPVMREFYLERSAVMEERLMRYESRGTGSLFEKFIASAFLAHPYRHPIIGWRSNIKHFLLSDVKKFYRKNYIPSRMTIAIVGRQNCGRTFRIVKKYFGRMGKRIEPPGILTSEPPQNGERRFVLKFKANPYLTIGWHKPTFPSRDDYICDLLSAVLSEGKTSRLYRALVLKKKIAASIDSWNGSPGARYDNLFVISATPRYPHTPGELEKAIYEEIERLKSDLNEKELEKVINRVEASMVFDLDSNMGVARLLSYYQTIFGDWQYVVNYIDELKSIKIDEIKNVISKYFTRENRTVGILLKKDN